MIDTVFHANIVSIPWILVLYKKRKRTTEVVSFLFLVIVRRRGADSERR